MHFFLTSFSDHYWGGGYGSWSLFFGTKLVEDFAGIAAGSPADLDEWEKYEQALRFLQKRPSNEQAIRVFAD